MTLSLSSPDPPAPPAPRKLNVAIVQFASGETWEADAEAIEKLIASAHAMGARLIALPDHLDGVTGDMGDIARAAPPEGRHPTVTALAALAKNKKVWILCGSLLILDKSAAKPFLRAFLFSPDGTVAARYDRKHLFHVPDSPSPLQREADYLCAGLSHSSGFAPLFDGVCLGIATGFDLRFPDLYRDMAAKGAQILCTPALFSVPHGEAHWDTLLRARAIETGSFVIAPAQSGPHACGRYSWGQSLIIDPWGRTLASAGGAQSGIAMATLDLAKVTEARRALSSFS